MITYQYNKCGAIQVVGWMGKRLDQGREMTRPEFLPFEERMRGHLDRISGTRTGKLLFESLVRTGKTVKIHAGNDWDDSAATMNPNLVQNGPSAAIQPFRPAHHNVNLDIKGSEMAWRGQVPTDDRTAKVQQIKQQMIQLGQKTRKAETAPVLRAILNRTHLGMTLEPKLTNNRFLNPMTQLPERLNIGANAFHDMASGFAYMPDGVYYPLCFLLYDYLLPGPGMNTQIRFANNMTFDHDFKNDFKKENKLTRSNQETQNRLGAAVLAHELIHAWRMMAGRKVVAGGWEEEAMTSGIGPFSNWRLTENRFRADLGLSTRMTYAANTHSSELMAGIHQSVTTKGYRGMMF